MPSRNVKNLEVHLAIAGLLIAIFLLDTVTRLGIADWILYIAPIGLCLLLGSLLAPMVVAFAASVLTVVGFIVSPMGADPTAPLINRAIGIFTFWCVAFVVRQTLQTRARLQRLSWLSEGQARVATRALGDLRTEEVGSALLGVVSEYVGAQVGAIYRIEDGKVLRVAAYAMTAPAEAPAAFDLGESVVGQVARSNKAVLLTELPPDYLKVTSAAGAGKPQSVVVAPITTDGLPYGVVELGFTRKLADDARVLDLLARIAGDLGEAIRTALYRQRVVELLTQTERQGEALQAQQRELRVANEELQESQARLENQQAELEATNAQLEAQSNDLERQKHDLLRAQAAISASARKVERASRYKSEFLANMSHELRTPLNSSLILAKVLADNAAGNLSAEQVGYANSIQASNNDLLALINDILDLSRIEAGHAQVEVETVPLADIVDPLRNTFEPVASQRRVAFRISISAHAPGSLTTDPRRLQQILRNLLSNALKFTEAGSVELRISALAGEQIAFAVEDTGIGIAREELGAIFEAFHQADGTTSRKYGGTGLGLSISRELASLLGGRIEVQSTVGTGSVFTLSIPRVLAPSSPAQGVTAPSEALVPPAAPAGRARVKAGAAPQSEHIDDDRAQQQRERRILVVEDDPKFARILYGLAHELDLDCVHTPSGDEALALARELRPSGIILDVQLPDHSGLSVLERLKRDPATRHIPVHMMSVEDHTQSALELGAIGYTLKPSAREQLLEAMATLKSRMDGRRRKVLIVEDDATMRASIALLLQADDVEVTAVGSAAEALEAFAATPYDCIVMDLALPDTSGFELLERVSEGGRYAGPPVIVYTGRALTPAEEQRLRRYSHSIIIKGARSPERLLDEVTLFLHRVESSLPPDQQALLRQARQRDAALEGRCILLAEDDVRNIYALSSVLEPRGVTLAIARNGREAIERLATGARVDLVLMDVMMPEMDGLTAIREIRKSAAMANLPIVALTAKAMPEDRQACLEAGANDYISKPIDVDRMLSLCRVWMPK